MTLPTILSPWFVVQRMYSVTPNRAPHDGMEYYCSQEVGADSWTDDKRSAMLFMSIHSAARVAQAEAAEIRALVTAQEAEEFGRGENR